MRRFVVAMALVPAILVALAGRGIAETASFSGPRHALVIGVGAYRNVAPLPSPRQDAQDVAAALRGLGFMVTTALDPSRAQMDKALFDFSSGLPRDALAFVFYSGHGVEAGGRNLLLPADFPRPDTFANMEDNAAAFRMSREAVVLDDLLDVLANAQPRHMVVVLDACRNNPLQPEDGPGARKKALGGEVGLAAIAPRSQAYIMYAAGARQKAVDRLSSADTARNSLFTRHLLAELAKPSLALDRAFKNAATRVEREAREKGGGHRQRPALYTDVYEDIVLAAVPPAPPPGLQAPRATADRWDELEGGRTHRLAVLANDAALGGGRLRVASVGPVSVGRVEVSADGTEILYTPPPRTDGGEVSFLYRVREDGGGEAEGRVVVGLARTPQPSPGPTARVIPVVGVFPNPQSVFRDCPSCPELVVVPAGSFTMGSPISESGRGNDEDQHRVIIAHSFAAGRYEVSFAEWDACVAGGGCNGHRPEDEGWGRGKMPVINVSWEDAKAYVQWLSRKTGQQYRLLSDDEWEYAARGGTTTPFWWGGTITSEQANYNGTYRYAGSGQKGTHRQKTVAVDTFSANPFGLYNVHGNVGEWVDGCLENYKATPVDGTSYKVDNCGYRVLRGGSWNYAPRGVRSAYRSKLAADSRFSGAGFRVARPFTP